MKELRHISSFPLNMFKGAPESCAERRCHTGPRISPNLRAAPAALNKVDCRLSHQPQHILTSPFSGETPVCERGLLRQVGIDLWCLQKTQCQLTKIPNHALNGFLHHNQHDVALVIPCTPFTGDVGDEEHNVLRCCARGY